MGQVKGGLKCTDVGRQHSRNSVIFIIQCQTHADSCPYSRRIGLPLILIHYSIAISKFHQMNKMVKEIVLMKEGRKEGPG